MKEICLPASPPRNKHCLPLCTTTTRELSGSGSQGAQAGTGGCRWAQVGTGQCRWAQVGAGGQRKAQVRSAQRGCRSGSRSLSRKERVQETGPFLQVGRKQGGNGGSSREEDRAKGRRRAASWGPGQRRGPGLCAARPWLPEPEAYSARLQQQDSGAPRHDGLS